jgi:hypothetical protein
MRSYLPLAVLSSLLAACSASETVIPTDQGPAFTESCQPPRLTVLNPAPVTKPRNTVTHTRFTVKNNCTTTIGGWSASASRTGAVATINAVTPTAIPTLAPGASTLVDVNYTTGSSAGTGTVVLTVTNDPGTLSKSGSLTVTVSP